QPRLRARRGSQCDRGQRRRPARQPAGGGALPRRLGHRAGIGGDLSEAAALPVRPSHQPLKVTVFRVSILPALAYFQISNTAEPMSPFLSKSTGLNAPS